jgi:Mrp family chromosome partitioning ATPase
MSFNRSSDDGSRALSAHAEQAVGPYLLAVRRHWRVVVIVTVLAAVVAAITVNSIAKNYQASASVLVTPLPQGDPTFSGLGTVLDTTDPSRAVQTAAALIETQQAAAGAAQLLGSGWTAAAVQSAVSVAPRGQSDVLAVTAQASSPGDAAKVANAYATSSIAYRATVVQGNVATEIASLESHLALLRGSASNGEAQALATTIAQLRSIQRKGTEPTLAVSQIAQPPSSPPGAANWLVVLLALVGGFALGSIAALGLETFSRPIRDRDELEAIYSLPTLASIPNIKGRRQKGRLPPWAFTPAAFEQIRLLRVQLSLDVQSPVIMVTSAGPGDGKTTVAAALAAAFAEIHESVILMDLDIRRPQMSTLLEISHSNDTGSESSAPPYGVPVPVARLPGVRVLPPPRHDMATIELHMRGLPGLLAEAQRQAGAVIIDTSPVGEISDGLRIAPLCDQVVFVVRPRHTDRKQLEIARDRLERAGAVSVGLVLVGQDEAAMGGYYEYRATGDGYETGLNGGAREPFPVPQPDRPANTP